jgi:opacity protein-like surface antigen
MKKIIYLLSAISLIAVTNASAMVYEPGPYLGGQVGWGRIDEGNGYKDYVNSQTSPIIDLGTFTGWRLYAGYSFIPFFSLEGGYTYYPDNTYTYSTDTINVKSYTIDIVGKLILPFAKLTTNEALSHFSIYGKGGGAYINTKIDTINDSQTSSATIRPTYGAGIIYNFTDNIALDASWTGVSGRNKVTKDEVAQGRPVPTCNLFTLGLSYKFTEIF